MVSNQEILKRRRDLFNSRKGIRVGDYIDKGNKHYTRVTHIHPNGKIQTGGSSMGSYYLNSNGNLSYSDFISHNYKLQI